jgi:hypothetical protein
MHDIYREHYRHLDPAHIGGTTPEDVDDLSVFTDVVELSGCQSILEIGMNQGASALWFLLHGCHVHSIDTTEKLGSIRYLVSVFPEQFIFTCMDSKDIISRERKVYWHGRFDLAFIDGDHSSPSVDLDATHCIQLGIPYLLFDDTHHIGHQNIRQLIDDGVVNNRWTIVKDYEVGCGKTLVKVL